MLGSFSDISADINLRVLHGDLSLGLTHISISEFGVEIDHRPSQDWCKNWSPKLDADIVFLAAFVVKP